MKTTNERLVIFTNAISAWLAKYKEDTRARDIAARALELTQVPGMAYNKQREVITKKHCAVEPAVLNGKENPRSGIILRDEKGNLCFTLKGEEACEAELIEWFKAEIEVETVEPLSAEDVKSMKLTKDERDAFAGFVIADGPKLEVVA